MKTYSDLISNKSNFSTALNYEDIHIGGLPMSNLAEVKNENENENENAED
jgi:hypothetical protein